jgi:hypothetical protein
VGGEMNKRLSRITVAITLIVLIVGVSTLADSTQFIESDLDTVVIYENSEEDVDMLIFISYISSVKDDLGWNVKIIVIKQENNDYRLIDQIIEMYYDLYNIKACIMVGEDTDTALGGHNNYMKKPSIVPWFTTGGEDCYEISENKVICKPYVMDICISLLYPTSELDYSIKKSQLIYAFNKFSDNRNNFYNPDMLVFESSDLNFNSIDMYQDLGNYGNLQYRQDPTYDDIKKSLNESFSMYFVHGHSNPSGTSLNPVDNIWFSADNVDEINAPFFGADGCYVGGWWSNKPDSNNLDSSIDCCWYGSKIFTSKNVVVMALGLLSQSGFLYSVSFIENAIPGLFAGKTLAESMIGQIYIGDSIIIGDPTFHFTN